MGKQTKKMMLATLLIASALLTFSNLIPVQALSLEDLVKPAAPEFTVKIVAHPYDVPPETTTTIDQYTGKETTTTTPGYHVENKSIEITILNPTFTPIVIDEATYWDRDEQKQITVECNITAEPYYFVRVKGHYGDSWKGVVQPEGDYRRAPQSNVQLDSKYTVLTIGADYPQDTKLDFQVKVGIAYYNGEMRCTLLMGYRYYGQDSDWSNTQILTMDKVGNTAVPDKTQPTPKPTIQPAPTTSATPTQSPTQPVTQTSTFTELYWEQATIALMSASIIALVAGFVLYHKRAQTTCKPN